MRHVVVCSLELDALEAMMGGLRDAGLEVHPFPLRVNELNKTTKMPPFFEGGAILIVHVVEGRALLLDDDGYYNHFLHSCAHRAMGDVFLALAGCREALGGKELFDESVVRELSAPQPSVRSLADQRRFLTLGETLSKFQVAHLRRARSLEPLRIPEGVKAKALLPSSKRGAIGLCPIL